MMKIYKMSCLLFLGFGTPVFSQQVINSSGQELKGSGGQASVSIGQVSYRSAQNPFDYINSGVQQVRKLKISSIGNTEHETIRFQLFPNPAHDHIIVTSLDEIDEEISFYVFDAKGKQVQSGNFAECYHKIDISYLPNGIYSLIIGGKNETHNYTFTVLQ